MKKILIIAFCLFNFNAVAAGVVAEEAYIRLLPPTQKVTGAFMVLKNHSAENRAVVSAQSDVSASMELHTHVHDNGVMRMRQVEKIDVPAQGEAVLKPGGLHMMLIGLKQPLTLGQIVDIKLSFDDGSSDVIQAEVKKILSGMSGMKKKMQHQKTMDHGKMKEMTQ